MELEADRPRLDGAHAGKEDGGEQLLVAGPIMNLGGRGVE